MVRGSEYIDVRHQEDNYHEFDAILTVHRRQYVEIKCQLDATEVFLLRILLLAQHVSGTTMPIIRSSRVLYSGCCLWYFMLWFFKLLVWCGAEGYVSGLQDAAASCKPLLHLVGILFPHINDDARSKSHQIFMCFDFLYNLCPKEFSF